jgi:hypothetical protein
MWFVGFWFTVESFCFDSGLCISLLPQEFYQKYCCYMFHNRISIYFLSSLTTRYFKFKLYPLHTSTLEKVRHQLTLHSFQRILMFRLTFSYSQKHTKSSNKPQNSIKLSPVAFANYSIRRIFKQSSKVFSLPRQISFNELSNNFFLNSA